MANKRVGLLSCITGHDLLNFLTAVDGYVALAREKEDPESSEAYLAKCRRSLEAAFSLIRFTKDCEALGTPVPGRHPVGELLARAAARLDLEDTRTEPSVDGPEIFADPMVEKVLHNLIDDSLRHGGGVSFISLSCRDDGGRPVLTYRDDGVGVPADDKARILEREYGKNTGLGLYPAKDILAIAGIDISEVGRPREGAAFELAVPRGPTGSDRCPNGRGRKASHRRTLPRLDSRHCCGAFSPPYHCVMTSSRFGRPISATS